MLRQIRIFIIDVCVCQRHSFPNSLQTVGVEIAFPLTVHSSVSIRSRYFNMQMNPPIHCTTSWDIHLFALSTRFSFIVLTHYVLLKKSVFRTPRGLPFELSISVPDCCVTVSQLFRAFPVSITNRM